MNASMSRPPAAAAPPIRVRAGTGLPPHSVPLSRPPGPFHRPADPHALSDALWHAELTARLDARAASAAPEDDWRGLAGLLATLVAASLAAALIVVLMVG